MQNDIIKKLSDIEITLKRMELKLIEKIEDSQAEIIGIVDKHKADKVTVNTLEKRVQRLENTI